MVTITDGVLTPVSERLPANLFPSDLFSTEDVNGSILDRIYVLDSSMVESEGGTLIGAMLAFDGEIIIGIPACPALSIVVGAGLSGYTIVPVKLLLGADWYVEFDSFQFALRVDRSVLRPVDPAATYTEITLTSSIRVSPKGIEFPSAPALTLPKSYLGETQVAVSASNIKFDFWRDSSIPEVTAAGLGDQFMGLYIQNAAIELPPDINVALPSQLVFSECFIGSGGFTGEVTANWTPGAGAPGGSLLGFDFELHSIELALRESAFVRASIVGLLKKIPYFDKPALVDVSFGAGGKLSVSVAAQQPAGISTSPEGLVRLEIPNVVQLDVQSLSFEHSSAETLIALSGTVTPLISLGGGTWPSLQLKRLAIDTRGRLTVDGGWVDLPDQYAIDLYGFRLELSRIGFGTVENKPNDHWFGLTGAVRCTEFLPAGFSLDGFRVVFGPSYPTPVVSFEGIGLEFGIPDVFHFSGSVAYKQLTGAAEFRGKASLELYALDVAVDVQVLIGHNDVPSYNYAFLFLDAKLVPSGIPIFNTGLSLYGFAGLYVQNMEPKLNQAVPESDRLYDWYRNPTFGVTDRAKWTKTQGAMAVGLGVTFGTADAGFSFSAKALVAVLLPRTVIVIDGKANFLETPSPQTSGSEGEFHTFALWDSRSGSVDIAVDANYRIPKLLEAHADARAHFETANSSAWFIDIGREQPPERRVTAHLFDGLLDGWMFIRIDPTRVRMGAGIEFHKRLTAGPGWIKVDASASIVGQLAYSPKQFEASGRLHGSARAGIKGVSVGVTIDVAVDLSAPRPFLIEARFRACADLWIKTICVTFPFERRDESPPNIPGPIDAISIRHPHPVMESSGAPAPSSWPLELDLSGGLVTGVPPDGLIDITFHRQVKNASGSFVVGDAAEDKWHSVGEQSLWRYQYRVTSVRLYDEGSGSATDIAAATQVQLHGAWQRASSINTVLEIGATTPFSGSSASMTAIPVYDPTLVPVPCDPLPPPNTEWVCADEVVSADYAKTWGLAVRGQMDAVGTRSGSGSAGAWTVPAKLTHADRTEDEHDSAACRPRVRHSTRQILTVMLRDSRLRVPLLVFAAAFATAMSVPFLAELRPLLVWTTTLAVILYFGLVIVAEWISDEVAFIYCGEGCRCRGYPGGPAGGRPPGGEGPAGRLPGEKPGGELVVVHVCREVPVTDGRTRESGADYQQRIADWITETSSWAQTKDILRPNRQYRLEVTCVTELKQNDASRGTTQTPIATRFRTSGPPSAPGSLAPYILWTVPAFAPGATARRAYRGYDIGVLFNETYLDVMYVANGDDIELRLVDNNGEPMRDTSGNPIVLPNVWNHAPNRVLTREESVLTAQIEAGKCLPTIELATQPLASVSPASIGGLLRPETYYEIHLTRKNDPAKTILARLSFVTSRFATFSDMVGSFLSTLALARDVPGLSGNNLATADFETLASALGIAPKARPQRFTLTPLIDGAQCRALLVDSPEPVEWGRIVAQVGSPALAPIPYDLRIVASADEATAFLIPMNPSGSASALPLGASCNVLLYFKRYLSSEVPIYSVQGNLSGEFATLTFTPLGGP